MLFQLSLYFMEPVILIEFPVSTSPAFDALNW